MTEAGIRIKIISSTLFTVAILYALGGGIGMLTNSRTVLRDKKSGLMREAEVVKRTTINQPFLLHSRQGVSLPWKIPLSTGKRETCFDTVHAICGLAVLSTLEAERSGDDRVSSLEEAVFAATQLLPLLDGTLEERATIFLGDVIAYISLSEPSHVSGISLDGLFTFPLLPYTTIPFENQTLYAEVAKLPAVKPYDDPAIRQVQLEHLITSLADDNYLTRAAVPYWCEAALSDKNENIRTTAMEGLRAALANAVTPVRRSAVENFRKAALENEREDIRQAAVESLLPALSDPENRSTVEAVINAGLAHENPAVRNTTLLGCAVMLDTALLDPKIAAVVTNPFGYALTDKDPAVRATGLQVLRTALSPDRILPYRQGALAHLRMAALESEYEDTRRDAVEALIPALDDPDISDDANAVFSAGLHHESAAVRRTTLEGIAAMFNDEKPDIRTAVAGLFGQALNDNAEDVRQVALALLRTTVLENEHEDSRRAAAEAVLPAVSHFDPVINEAANNVLSAGLDHSNAGVRRSTYLGLIVMLDDETFDYRVGAARTLLGALNDPDAGVRAAGLEGLRAALVNDIVDIRRGVAGSLRDEALTSEHPDVRRGAAGTLTIALADGDFFVQETAEDGLHAGSTHKNAAVRLTTLQGLVSMLFDERFTARETVPARCGDMLYDEDAAVRNTGLEGLRTALDDEVLSRFVQASEQLRAAPERKAESLRAQRLLRKVRAIRRNALRALGEAALGNEHDEIRLSAMAIVITAHVDEDLRQHVERVLRVGTHRARGTTQKVFMDHIRALPDVLTDADMALMYFILSWDDRTGLYSIDDTEVRFAAVERLSAMHSLQAVPLLEFALRDRHKSQQIRALEGLKIAATSDASEDTQIAAVAALQAARHDRSVTADIRTYINTFLLVTDISPEIRQAGLVQVLHSAL